MKMAARFTPARALALTLSWVAVLAVTGSTDALLFLAPALLIAIPLLGGRYVGEELIAKLVARRRDRARPRSASPLQPMPPAPATWLPRGTRLIAFGLAKRPPPARLAPQN
ncbi:MAG TPA: hypothetical protein VJU14_09310 [Solirubrobacterales bacterium]|nr:hypothetical protein [Solirubrobacterales bacterium]